MEQTIKDYEEELRIATELLKTHLSRPDASPVDDEIIDRFEEEYFGTTAEGNQ